MAVVDVPVIGTGGVDERFGAVHPVRDGDTWMLYCHRTEGYESIGGYEWDASHYADIAVYLHQGGGVESWYRRLHTSGRRRWHKLVPHPDGSVRDHWLVERDHVFTDWFRAASAKAVPVSESPFADQALYDELRERDDQTRTAIELHLDKIRAEAEEADSA